MGLTESEINIAKSVLGRELTEVELALLNSHWSEHCSYKSTRRWLKQLPSKAPWVVRGPGTDAPLVEITPGLYITFKIESHNHPSAVDPYNGAATGVGGIIRDILTVGAKPIGLLVNLHFGELDNPHAEWIATNVVRGISDYGNRVGVPVVGGETWFDPDFTHTPIVLATCVGLVRAEEVPKGGVKAGDLFIVVGSGADRSGLAGSAFASKTLSGEEDLGAVQVADPLMGKRLIDLVQEARHCVKYIKDLGGGGLATAAVELAEWFNLGLELRLDAVHTADRDMGPVEVLTGETQERLVFVTDDLECLAKLLDKYDVTYSIVGKFVEGGRLKLLWRGETVADLPISLTAPEVEWAEASYNPPELPHLPQPPLEKAIDLVLSSPNVAKKESIYRKFDFDVGVRTVLKPGEGDAAVLKLHVGNLGVAVKGDANPRYSYLNPRLGAANVFVKAYRNVVVAGGWPLAAVDSINVGSPARPEVYWQFKESVLGIAEAARSLQVPVVGGKVSLYNEWQKPIKPTVVVVVLGKVDDVSHVNRAVWSDGDKIYTMGVTRDEVGGSEYLYRVFGLVAGVPPAVDYGVERELLNVMTKWRGKIRGATDVGLGGYAVAFAKLAVNSGVGAEIDVCKAHSQTSRVDFLLFSESNGRLITTGEEGPGVEVGTAGGEELVYKCGSTILYRRSVSELTKMMTL